MKLVVLLGLCLYDDVRCTNSQFSAVIKIFLVIAVKVAHLREVQGKPVVRGPDLENKWKKEKKEDSR